jgi:hypothetical protein
MPPLVNKFPNRDKNGAPKRAEGSGGKLNKQPLSEKRSAGQIQSRQFC